jgi:hypothetical protein
VPTRTVQPGDWIHCLLPRHDASPGRDAVNLRPCTHGEAYRYDQPVRGQVLEARGASLVIEKPDGERFFLELRDGRVRRCSWWERIGLRLARRLEPRERRSTSGAA